MHPLGGLCPHREVGVGTTARHVIFSPSAKRHPSFVGPVGSRGEVALDPNDGVNACVASLLPKFEGTKHVSVIGHCDCRHFLPGHFGNQFRDSSGAIEHRILGVHMQVREAVVSGH